MKHLRVLLSLAMLAVAGTSFGQRASNWRAYRLADGLPESPCISVTYALPGKVVVRHLSKELVSELDGYSVTVAPAPPGVRSRVYASPGGQLWTASAQGLEEFRDGEWVTHPVREIAAVAAARTLDPVPLCPVKQGVVLVLLPDRLLEFNADNAGSARSSALRTVEQTHIGKFTGLGLARDGGLWISGSGGVAKLPGPLRTLKANTEWVEYVAPASLKIQSLNEPREDAEGKVTMLAEAADAQQKVVVFFDGQTWTRQEVSGQRIRRAWRGPDAQDWVATVDSLFQLSETGQGVVENEEISARSYFDVAVEPGGTFWLATSDGLFRYTPLPWRTPRSVQQINSLTHCLTSDQQGNLWFIAGNHLHVLKAQKHQEFLVPEASWHVLQAARALFPLKDGRLVLDTGEATYEVAPGAGEMKPLTSGEGGFRLRVLGIMKDGSLCVQKCAESLNQDCRFLVYDGSRFRPLSESPGEIDIGSDYSTFFSSQNGDLWVSAERGTAWYHDKKWRAFSSADKTAPDSALNFIEMADGRIWCATREQVWEFDGKNWTVVGRGFERINGLVRTRDGNVWLSSNIGAHRFVQGAWVENGVDEGLSSPIVREVYEDSRGNLWAGTTHGLSLFHPEADPDPPKTFIQNLTEEQKNVPEGRIVNLGFWGLDKWKCTPRARLLYSYRLDDRDWSGFQENSSATFSDLSPGKHYFRVRAMDRSGNVDPEPVQLEFAVVLPWYKESRLVLISIAGLGIAMFFAGLAFNRHRRLLLSYAEVERKVTERTHELELANRELLHSQKMTALGTLAAGIAHDFNNILSIIKGSAQIIEDNLDQPKKVATRVDRIKTVVEQGSGIVKAMLGFSRDTDRQTGPCDINSVVEDTLKLLGDRFMREVQVHFEPGGDLPQINASRDLIQQILLNFIFNAAESLGTRKEVFVTTAAWNKLPAGLVRLPASAPGYVCIAVRDFGCGISAETMPRIFEPFFTTKAFSARRGTGLGLSMVYELAKKMEAGLAVESVEGQGSTFMLILPVLPVQPDVAQNEKENHQNTHEPERTESAHH